MKLNSTPAALSLALAQTRSLVTTPAAGSDTKAKPKPSKRMQERIGVIGAGMMGEALIRGFINSGISSPGRISCSVDALERRQLYEGMGVGNVFDAAELGGAAGVAANSDIVVLAIKPQVIQPVLDALAPHLTPRHLVVSIAAGIRLARMEAALGPGTRVVRVMPNTPCLVQCGASAYALGSAATQRDADLVRELLGSVGLAMEVDEKMVSLTVVVAGRVAVVVMDAVTGLSGSGPAFAFLVIEALADGGVAAGLPRNTALALAAKTMAGAAAMVLESGAGSLTHPGVLKDKVASPGGTTIAGLMELESSGVRGAVMRAVKAAAIRSEELG
ncbi:hypothetical protein N2152v2_001972 [Parachlorella kessleri]